MDTSRRVLIDYTQRGKSNCQGKQGGSWRVLTPTTLLSDSSRMRQVFPRQSQRMSSESNPRPMSLSFATSTNPDRWVEGNSDQLLGYDEAIRWTILPDAGHLDYCQDRVEGSEDSSPKPDHCNEIARMLSPRQRRNALSLTTSLR